MTKPLKILLLDDDADELVIVKRLLDRTSHPYSLDWSTNPDEVLEDVRRGSHDVYLIDYLLGAVTGLEVIEQALAAGAEAPMILLTGTQTDHGIDLEALRLGAADYLNKQGLTAENLDRSIRYACERMYWRGFGATSSAQRKKVGASRRR